MKHWGKGVQTTGAARLCAVSIAAVDALVLQAESEWGSSAEENMLTISSCFVQVRIVVLRKKWRRDEKSI